MLSRALTALVILSFCSAARAEAQSDEKRENCQLRSQDSTFAAGGIVYRECAVDTKAKLMTDRLSPDFRPNTTASKCYSATFEFVVDKDGLVELPTASVSRANSDEFAESVKALLPKLRFEPAKRDDAVVRQIFSYHTSIGLVARVVSSNGSTMGAPSARPPRC